MSGPKWEPHDERRSLSQRAARLNLSAVQSHQLLHEGEPDSRAFKVAAAGAFNTMESLEQAPHFGVRHTDAGILDLQKRVTAVRSQPHADRAVERELECI